MGNPAKVRIETDSRVKKGIDATTKRLKRLGRVAIGVSRRIGSVAGKVGAMFKRLRGPAIAGAGAAIAGVGLAIKKSFDFEAARIQFKVLLGSMDAAKKRFKELQEFSASTPFQLTELIEASKTVENFSGGLLDNGKVLNLTGDAAAALGKDVQEVTFWYSRFFALTRGGQATGEERRRMLELGLLSAEAATELKNLADEGKGLDVQMGVLNREFRRFEGGMAELSTTGHGLFSTLKDNWTLALATFGDEFKELVKNDIRNLISKLQDLRKDGTITKWANSAVKSLKVVRSLISDIFSGGKQRAQAFADIGAVLSAAWKDAASAAVAMMLKAAPLMGHAIWQGFAGGLDQIRQRNAFIRGQRKAGISKEDAKKMWSGVQELVAISKGNKLAAGFNQGGSLASVIAEILGRRSVTTTTAAEQPKPKKGQIRKKDDAKRPVGKADETILDEQGNVLMSGISASSIPPQNAWSTTGPVKEPRGLMKWKTGGALSDRPESQLKTVKGIGMASGDVVSSLEDRLALRMGKPIKSAKDIASSTRRGLGLGELADIAQFGFKKGEKPLGTKNNPMTVQVTKDAMV